MKSKLFVFTFFILHFTFYIQLFAQNTWIHTYSPFYIDDGWYDVEDVIICQDGGYAVNGTYVEYDSEFGIEWAHWGFLMKTDSDGNFLWAKADTVSFMYENNSLAFVETIDGGFISAVSSGNLIKRDANGNREWVINGDFGINSMCNTNDGNIILGGCQNLNIGLRKIDENGNALWTQVYQIDDDNTICKSITELQNGGYALTGYIGYSGSNDSDVLIMITDTTGDSLWTTTFDGYGYRDKGNCIIETNDTNLMIVGKLGDPNGIGFLWYLDNSGNTIWTQEVDSSIGFDQFSVISQQENVFTALCNSPDGTKVYNFDNFYNIAWECVLPGWAAEGDRGFKKLQDSGYVIGGTYPWCSNIMLAKTDDYGNVTAVDDYILQFPDFELSNFPNPFNPTTTIMYKLPRNIKNPVLEITNVKGQLVYKLSIANHQSSIVWNGKSRNKNTVSSGVYFFRIKSDNFISKTSRMILLK